MVSSRGIRAGAAYVELYAHDSKLVRGLKRASRRLKAFGANVRDIGARLVKASAVMATPLVAGAKVYADFEQQMANVATMLDKPAEHMDAFKKGIRAMAVEFGESTETLAGGLYDILSASIPAEKALDVLSVAVRAAKAGMTDTKTAADAITTVGLPQDIESRIIVITPVGSSMGAIAISEAWMYSKTLGTKPVNISAGCVGRGTSPDAVISI